MPRRRPRRRGRHRGHATGGGRPCAGRRRPARGGLAVRGPSPAWSTCRVGRGRGRDWSLTAAGRHRPPTAGPVRLAVSVLLRARRVSGAPEPGAPRVRRPPASWVAGSRRAWSSGWLRRLGVLRLGRLGRSLGTAVCGALVPTSAAGRRRRGRPLARPMAASQRGDPGLDGRRSPVVRSVIEARSSRSPASVASAPATSPWAICGPGADQLVVHRTRPGRRARRAARACVAAASTAETIPLYGGERVAGRRLRRPR